MLRISLPWERLSPRGRTFSLLLAGGALAYYEAAGIGGFNVITRACKRACDAGYYIEAQRYALSFVICGEDEIRTRDTRICV